MDPGRPTRWGIMGAGFISNDFCLAMRTLPTNEHQLVAVAARKLDSAEAFAKKHGITKAYDSYEELTKDSNVDVVYIGTIHTNHVRLSLMAMSAGKHVVSEKPLSMTAANAKKVVEYSQQKKLLFVEGVWSRFFPAYEQLRRDMAAGTIGDVIGVNACFGLSFDWTKMERMYKRELGGGVMKDLGTYPVQLACMVFGNEKPEKIIVHGYLHNTGVDRQVCTMLCYKGGRTAQLTVSGDCKLPNTAMVYGTKGVMELSYPFWCSTSLKTPLKTHEYELPQTPEPTVFDNSAGFVYEIQAVRRALLEGRVQVSQISHEDTVAIAEIQDEIMRQLGVKYDDEMI